MSPKKAFNVTKKKKFDLLNFNKIVYLQYFLQNKYLVRKYFSYWKKSCLLILSRTILFS